MPNLSWLPVALAIQILLAFFAPPLAFRGRSIFPSDIWILFWTVRATHEWLRALRTPAEKRKVIVLSGLIALAFLIPYAHGQWRTSLIPALERVYPGLAEDRFESGREFLIAIRFLSWSWAGVLVFQWFPTLNSRTREETLQLLLKTLITSLSLSSAVIVLAKIWPIVGNLCGSVFGYDPYVPHWRDRVFGVFRSPVEGSLCLGFGLVLLLPRMGRIRQGGTPQWAFIFLVLLGMAFTKTVTAFGAGFLTLLVLGTLELKKPWKWIAPLLVLSVLGILSWQIHETLFFRQKVGNFLYRIEPWKIYLRGALSRPDFLILGMGYSSLFTDNIYVFLLNRGGLLLSCAAGFGIWRIHQSLWKNGSLPAKATFLFPLIAGLSVDSWIIRPMAYLIICVGLPILASDRTDSTND